MGSSNRKHFKFFWSCTTKEVEYPYYSLDCFPQTTFYIGSLLLTWKVQNEKSSIFCSPDISVFSSNFLLQKKPSSQLLALSRPHHMHLWQANWYLQHPASRSPQPGPPLYQAGLPLLGRSRWQVCQMFCDYKTWPAILFPASNNFPGPLSASANSFVWHLFAFASRPLVLLKLPPAVQFWSQCLMLEISL